METTYTQLLSRFVAPEAEFRPQVFWVWNGCLEQERIAAQIADMAAQGLGGFFIHPMGENFRLNDFIQGIEPVYLSDGYFQAIHWAVEAAEEHGLYAWLYDEGGWPSGSAQGRVVEGHPEFSATVLSRQMVEATTGDHLVVPDNFVAAVGLPFSGKLPVAIIPQEGVVKIPPTCRTAMIFVATPVPHRSDLLNPQAVQRFIEVTHERYAEVVGNYFGTVIPGMFTDEPSVPGCVGSGQIQWTSDLPVVFRQQFGEDLIPLLPALFPADADGEDWHKAMGSELVEQTRCAFVECWTGCFREAFFKTINHWCETHDLLHIGHVGGEDTLHEHGLHGFGQFFKTAGALDVPGVDAIWRQLCWNKQNVDYPRFASSARHQRAPDPEQAFTQAVISETNGVYGFGLTYQQMRWLVDFQVSCGINLFAPMCYGYDSTSGRLFRTQEEIGPNSPLWPMYHTFADYTGRLCSILQAGVSLADVAIYYPIEATWIDPQGPAASQAETSFNKLMQALNEEQVAFDIIDAETLCQAEINFNTVETPGEDYSTIIVPQTPLLPLAVAQRLLDLHAAGGRIVFLGAIPMRCSDFYKSVEYEFLYEQLQAIAVVMDAEYEASLQDETVNWDGFTAAFLGPRDTDHFSSQVLDADAVLIANQDEIGRLARLLALTCGRYAIQPLEIVPDLRLFYRQSGDIQIAFAMNASMERLDIKLGVVNEQPCVLERWFPVDGTRRTLLMHEEVSEISSVDLSLQPGKSALLVLSPLANMPSVSPVHRLSAREIILHEPVVIGNLQDPEEVWVCAEHRVVMGDVQILHKERKILPPVLGVWGEHGLTEFSGSVTYRFTVTVAEDYLDEEIFLDLGKVMHSAIVEINGERLEPLLWHPYVVEVSEYLKERDNEILVTVFNTLANQVVSERVINEAVQNHWYNTYYERAVPMMQETLDSGLVGPVRLFVRP